MKKLYFKRILFLGTIILIISSIIAYNIVSSNSNDIPKSATLVKDTVVGDDLYE